MKKLLLVLCGIVLSSPISASDNLIRLISTSDLHGFIKSYDYYQDEINNRYGLEGLLGEIIFLRENAPNHLLIDTGDTLVGSPLGDYSAETFLSLNEDDQQVYQSPIICALNALEYDIATLGNHEFDYGMPFLEQSYQNANFPIVTSNIIKSSGKTLYDPYVILERNIEVEAGVIRPIKIGFISNTPPQTMDLNRHKIEGAVYFDDQLQRIRETAREAKKAGADIIVVLSHSGLSQADSYEEGMENIVNFLLSEKEIDAVLYGHTHQIHSQNGDSALNTAPIAQPGKWGEAVAVIDLRVSFNDDQWRVDKSESYTVSRDHMTETKEMKQLLDSCVLPVEEALITDLNTPILETKVALNNTYNLLENDAIYTLLNNSQLAYLVEKVGQDIPLLSAVAPSTSILDPNYFIDIAPGMISKKKIIPAIYPATLSALQMKGSEIKTWLEISASLYNTQTSSENTLLISDPLTYLFYPIAGVSYEIDLSQPAIYNQFGQKIADGEGRIKELRYRGKLIGETDEFILIASSYAPYFANEMKQNRKFIDIGAPNNKTVLLEYLQKQPHIDLDIFHNWKVTAPKGSRAVLKLPNFRNTLPETSNLYLKEYNEDTQEVIIQF